MADKLMDCITNPIRTDISRIIRTVKDNKPNQERKLRTIGIIISPAEKRDR